MKKELTVRELARLGGRARAEKLTAAKKKAIAKKAGIASGKARKATPKKESPHK